MEYVASPKTAIKMEHAGLSNCPVNSKKPANIKTSIKISPLISQGINNGRTTNHLNVTTNFSVLC